MGFYKLSSQFTDYVLDNYNDETAEKILGQVVEAFSTRSANDPMDATLWARLGAFHGNPALAPQNTDQNILGTLEGDDNKKKQQLNAMYESLRGLEGTGQINKSVRNLIEKFLQRHWVPQSVEEIEVEAPAPEDQVRPGVVKGRRRKPQVIPEIEQPEPVLPWERGEERILRDIERKKGSELLYELFVTAGVLERVPDFNERDTRLAERKLSWDILSK